MTARGKTDSIRRIPVRWPTAGNDSTPRHRRWHSDGLVLPARQTARRSSHRHADDRVAIVIVAGAGAAPITTVGANLLSP